MKKGIKTFCKVLSVFLAVLFVIEILPLQVMAEEFTDAVAEKQFIEDFVNNPTEAEKAAEAEILYEVEEKRDEFTKVYKKTDGSYTAIVSKEPLHYLDNGVWEEIDNSLSSDGNTFTNASNIFNAIFPKSLDDNAQISIENGESEIAFSVNNISGSNGVVENAIGKSDTQIDAVDNAIVNTQSSITYEDVEADTDIQYIVTPNSIKENVIVSDKNSVKDSYSFTIEKGNLTCVLADDGSVSFINSKNEVEFSIPRPIMTDATLAFSYDIDVNVVDNNDGTIELIYSPSKEWTSSNDRVYPINIDPAIVVVSKYADWIEDNCVIDDSTNETDQDKNFINDYIGFVANVKETNSDGVTNTLKAEIYTKINPESFKNLGENIVFTDVQYILAGNGYGGKIIAKEVSESYNMETITHKDKPDHGDEVYDYYTTLYKNESDADANSEGFVFVHFNITKAFNDWLNGETNNGFVMVPEKEGTVGMFITDGVYSYTNPSTGSTTTTKYETNLIIDYVDLGGYNENLNYHSQSAGRAGTGYVNDFTQQLSVIRNDINMTDNNFPVTIGMIYDTATYDKLELLNYNNMIAYGNNWVPNYLRAYLVDDENQLTYYTATGASIDFTRSISENDEVIYTEAYSDIYGNHGYEVEYHVATEPEEYITVTRPDGYIESFNSNGLLTYVTNPGDSSQSTSIVYDSMFRIDYIIDNVGRKYDYIYCSKTNLLSKIRCCTTDCKHLITECTHTTDDCTSEISNCSPITDGSNNAILEIRYTYDENNNLETVTYPDGESVKYEYDNNGNMISMTNIDDYRIAYEYEVKDNDEDVIEYTDKVTSVTEQAKNGTTYVNGNSITYERLNSNQVKLTDATGDYEIYHFGNYGNLLYTIDNNGNYVMHEDVDSTEETHFASVSDYRAFSENLLSNSSFEEIDPDDHLKNWEISKTTNMQSNDVPALFGTKVLKISSDKNESVNIKQTVDVISAGDYTLSAYVYTEVNTNPLKIKLYYDDMVQDCITTSVDTANGKWERYTVTLNAPANTETITVELTTANGGVFYIDGVQLEQSSTASLYNYISNGSFNKKEVDENSNEKYIIDSWSYLNNSNVVTETVIPENINGKTVNALVLPGGENEVTESSQTVAIDDEENETTKISQTVAIDGKKNDIIRVGSWFKGHFINSFTNNVWLKRIIEESEDPKICNFTNDRYAYIEVKCENTTTNATQTIKIPFNENLSDWQFVARDFSLNGNYDKATIAIHYSKNLNTAMISNIELTKTKIRTTTYDSGEKPCPCVECTVINCPCNCDSKDICYCTQCMPENENTKRDAFANISLGNNYDEIVTSQLLSQRIGDNVTVNYNLSNGLYKAYVDAKNAFTSYDYNNAGVLKKISANGNEIDFTYENDRVTTINQNDTIYKFNYDEWGQVTQITIGDIPIVSYEYDSYEHRDRITKVTYGNNTPSQDITEFSYNNDNSIVVSVNGTEKYTCIFDTNGSLIEIQEDDGRKTKYINDKIEISKGKDELIYKFDIDTEGNYVETFGGTSFTTKNFGLYNENCTYKDTVEVSSNSAKNIFAEAVFDATGRYNPNTLTQIKNKSKEQVSVGMTYEYYDSNLYDNHNGSYVQNDDNELKIIRSSTGVSRKASELPETGRLIDSYVYTYKFNKNNNLVQETICDLLDIVHFKCDYFYDENNQLIRINQISNSHPEYYYDKDNNYNTYPIISYANSVTYTYEYDSAGNLRYKREYVYTTDENLDNHTPINVIAYGYNSNNEWKDQLMSYGSTSIYYDNIGNPTKFEDSKTNVTKQLTWNGKQLKSYTGSDTDKKINYEYDANGLCYRKIVTNDDTTETYDYIWSDGRLTGQIYTDSASNEYVIKYVYDLFNSPYGFIISKDDTEQMYLYLKNFKGDIIGVVNEKGHIVISYEYDAWGVLTNPQPCNDTTFANIISKLPITYRGYFYDYDTGLYYIQGRYYNPEWGKFINADSTSNLGSTGTALSYNLYAYCENNPVMYVVDNKNTAFSNTINANYLYNKRISKGITGYIDNQQNGIASKLRYGINTISPFGCGTVATYNALIMLGNRMDICDIIRDYEMNHAYHDGLIGTHGNNIARFFCEKGYDVTVTNLESLQLSDDEKLTHIYETIKENGVYILNYKSDNVGHFIVIKYMGKDSQGKDIYVTYNEATNVGVSDSIKAFIPNSYQPFILISILPPTNSN